MGKERNQLKVNQKSKQSLQIRVMRGTGMVLLAGLFMIITVGRKEETQGGTQNEKQELAEEHKENSVLEEHHSLQAEDILSASKAIAKIQPQAITTKNITVAPTQKQSFTSSTGQPSNKITEKSSQVRSQQSSVAWSSIKTGLQGHKLGVFWQTSFERNVSHFEVEASLDKSEFKSIGTMESQGSAETSNNNLYALVDDVMPQYAMPRVYYRIKMVGKDKREQTSDLIEHDFGLYLGVYFTVIETGSPNLKRVYFAGDQKGTFDLVVLREDGTIQHEQKLEAQLVSQSFDLNTQGWPQGAYQAKIFYKNITFYEKFTVE